MHYITILLPPTNKISNSHSKCECVDENVCHGHGHRKAMKLNSYPTYQF